MEIADDPVTLALTLAALLLVCIAVTLPAILRVIRMRRFQRVLGAAHWPFLVALEQRDSIHQEPRDG